MAPRLVRRTPLLRRPWQMWRHRGIEADDVFLCSYPKSGNTWLRFLLVQLLTGRLTAFDSVDDIVPYVGVHAKAPPLLPNQGRLVKSHEPYSRFYDHAYAKLVYLIRDGRDVAVSYYHTLRGLGWYDGEFSQFLREFLAGQIDGYGPWHQHIRGWLGHENGRRLLEIRYETMRERPVETLARIADFLGVPVEQRMLSDAVDANSAEAMRQRERSSGPDFPADRSMRFVRAAKAGSWKEQFSAEDHSRFLQASGGLLAELGYLAENESP